VRFDLSLFQEFLDSKSEKTRRNYLDAILEFAKECGYEDLNIFLNFLSSLTQSERESLLVKHISKLKKENSPLTVHMKITAIKHLLELYEANVNWKKIKMIMPRKKSIRMDKPVPKDVVRRVLPLLTPSKRLCIWFMFATGCRVGEALELKVGNLDLDSKPARAKIITEKSGIERVVFIPRDLAQHLREWVSKLQAEDYVFHSNRGGKHKLAPSKVRKAFQSALNRLGLLKRDASERGWNYTIHGLRDSFKTLLTSAGVQGLVVETLMGHDTGIDRSYYKPSVEELAREWQKAEEYLVLETVEISALEFDRIVKESQLIALEAVWSALNPNQPPEDLYMNIARFRLLHYPSIEEKIQIMREAIQTYTRTIRREGKEVIKEAFSEAIQEARRRRR